MRMVPAGFFAQGGERRQAFRDIVQRRPQGFDQPLARLGGGDAAGRAGEKAKPEPGFQPLQRMAEGGLGRSQLRGGAGEAAGFGHRQEGRQIAQVFPLHS
jgi:hypothetical protein